MKKGRVILAILLSVISLVFLFMADPVNSSDYIHIAIYFLIMAVLIDQRGVGDD